MTSLFAHGIWLSLVLGHAGVDGPAVPSAVSPPVLLPHFLVLDNVRADGRPENIWERVRRLAGGAVRRDDGDGRAGRHFVVGRGIVVVGEVAIFKTLASAKVLRPADSGRGRRKVSPTPCSTNMLT